MGLRILCAGCSADDRALAEVAVRAALGSRPASEAWRVSLVKMKAQWSVAIDAPDVGVRGLTIAAPDGRLQESISEALRRTGGPSTSANGATPSAEKREVKDQHLCPACRKSFAVTYTSEPDEALETVPAACPHCWQVTYVLVAESAGVIRDYRVDRISQGS